MTEVKKAETVGAGTPAPTHNPGMTPEQERIAGLNKAQDPKNVSAKPLEEKRAQELEVEKAQLEEAEKRQKVLDDVRMGKIVSQEGARPEYEPPIGTKPLNPIPSGLVVGGPVPADAEEKARLGRLNKGPEQAPGTKPV